MNISKLISKTAMFASVFVGISTAAFAQSLESLNRGLIGVNTNSGNFISWRMLGTDDKGISFDLYRDGTLVNTSGHITSSTNFTDTQGTKSAVYTLNTLNSNGDVIATDQLAKVWESQGHRIALDVPATVTNTGGIKAYYSPNDISVGDVDGDGEYEIILKWNPSDAKDNSQKGYTSNVYLDCYKMNGTKLWRINLGKNIRAGAHYTQHLVFDFDGDGYAEVACKTAPGSIDGTGNYVTAAATDATIKNANNDADYRNSSGIILSGPEYYTIFKGRTGAAIHTINYNPSRSIQSSWGDNYGNRCERYLSTVAFTPDANGVAKPTMINARGYYTWAYVWALQFDGTKLSQRWLYSSPSGSATSTKSLYGQGAHSMTAADVDEDGFDEIIFGSAALDHDGSFLYSTGWGHGDALHVGDFIPERYGLEVFMPHEEKTHAGTTLTYGHEMHDARTGEIIYSAATSADNGRGICADVSSSNRGSEFWSGVQANGSNAVFSGLNGSVISTNRPSQNFRIYWDGDLYDELLDGTNRNAQSENTQAYIQKWNESNKKCSTIATLNGMTCNTTKGTPCFSGDILGDWREEVILRDSLSEEDKGLIIYTTTIPSNYRITTLPHDHGYRIQMTSEQCAYNQPPHLSYWLAGQIEGYKSTVGFSTGSGAMNQTVEFGYPIADIHFFWKQAETVEVTGLPTGVTCQLDNATKTGIISGTPTENGSFNIKITTKNAVSGYSVTSVEGTLTAKLADELTTILYYSFDENTSNAISGANATVNGSYTPSFTNGVKGQAINFTASTYQQSDAIVEQHYSECALTTESFTLDFWFNSEMGNLSTIDAYLFHKGSHAYNATTGATGNWIGIEYKNGNLYFAIDDNKTKTQVSYNATEFFKGGWHHLIAVRDADNKQLRLYIDGALKASTSDATGNISQTENIVVGNVNVNFNNAYMGAIDELTLYKGVMSANKIAEDYKTYLTNIGLAKKEEKEETTFRVFTLTGMHIRTSASMSEALKNLSSGIYLINNRKIVIK